MNKIGGKKLSSRVTQPRINVTLVVSQNIYQYSFCLTKLWVFVDKITGFNSHMRACWQEACATFPTGLTSLHPHLSHHIVTNQQGLNLAQIEISGTILWVGGAFTNIILHGRPKRASPGKIVGWRCIYQHNSSWKTQKGVYRKEYIWRKSLQHWTNIINVLKGTQVSLSHITISHMNKSQQHIFYMKRFLSLFGQVARIY